MIKISYLLLIASQFLSERNWWPYHNFKNDVMNITVEVGELAEHFILFDRNQSQREKIAQEMADVLFGLCMLSLTAKIDIMHSIGTEIGKQELSDENCSYEQFEQVVLSHVDLFFSKKLNEPQQVVMSLVVQVSELADLFIWANVEQSAVVAHEKRAYLSKHIVHSIAHLIVLARLLEIDLPKEYLNKMERNAIKYPVGKSTEFEAINKIKDASRGRY